MDAKAIHRAAKIAAETTLSAPFAPYSHSIISHQINALISNRNIFSNFLRPSKRPSII